VVTIIEDPTQKKASYSHAASFSEAAIRPLRLGRRLWIGPAGMPPPEGGDVLPIWLGAGPAFGSGAHPTTQLCLRVLEQHLKPGGRVLDLGTGSAILAVAAARLGVEAVLALDIDPDAVAVARANVLQNDVADRVQIERGTLQGVLLREDHEFPWVMTNILAHIIIEFFEQGLRRVIAPGGWLVLSGFLRRQTPLMRAWLLRAELELLAQEQQGEWVCLVARRPSD
jgi:ribosomal protein L11 methyltransferase